MYYQHDWFMLQIQMMVQFIAKVTFQKDPFEIDALFDTEWGHTETDPLERKSPPCLPNPVFRRLKA